MVHSFEVQIQAYLKQHACPCASAESLGCTAKGHNYFGAHQHQMHNFGSFFDLNMAFVRAQSILK